MDKRIGPITVLVVTFSMLAPANGAELDRTAPSAQVATIARLPDIRLRGELETRYQASVCNLLTQNDLYTLDAFKASANGTEGALWWDWPGDQVGRWFSVLHIANGLGWATAGADRDAIADVCLPCQTELGNFGWVNPIDMRDAQLMSGNCFALSGLMDSYEDSGQPRFLEAAKKLAAYFEKCYPVWTPDKPIHEFYGHCIDGLVRVYEATGDKDTLAFAEKVAGDMNRTNHTHHSLSMCRGVIEVYRVTGDKKYLVPVEDYLSWCREKRLVDGGVPEGMPGSGQDEGCALADYVIVNLMMFRATGQALYLDEGENTLLNHFFMNQFHTGGFGHRGFGQQITGGKAWQGWGGKFGSENPGCCSFWGQWALGQVAQYAATIRNGMVEVNFYPQADIRLSNGITLEMSSDFPRMSQASIVLRMDKPMEANVSFRHPAWATGIHISVNGAPLAGEWGGRALISRTWNSGDKIDIRFDSGYRVVDWDRAGTGMVAIFDGPLCLGLTSAVADLKQFDSILIDDQGKLILDKDGKPQASTADGRMLSGLQPICQDWRWPDVKEPNHIRETFKKKTK